MNFLRVRQNLTPMFLSTPILVMHQGACQTAPPMSWIFAYTYDYQALLQESIIEEIMTHWWRVGVSWTELYEYCPT